MIVENGSFLAYVLDGGTDKLRTDMIALAKSLREEEKRELDGNESREALWALLAAMKARESKQASSKLQQLEKTVQKLGEDKEIAEERMQETLRMTESDAAILAESGSLEDERRRVQEIEQARRAVDQARNRTLEAQKVREQISIIVRENDRLRAELTEKRKEAEILEKDRELIKIEMEVWKERGIEYQKKLKL